MISNILVVPLLLFCLGCTSQQSEQLTRQQKDQIKNEIKVVCDSITATFERLDGEGAMRYYSDSPEWMCCFADGSRMDFETFKRGETDLKSSIAAWHWTTTRQDFIFLAKDIVLCAWDGKDDAILKSGDKITHDPHAYTMVFKDIAGQWKVIYFHDSGIPVTQKAEKM